MTIKEVVDEIKAVGINNVRKIPSKNGMINVQVLTHSSEWVTILENVSDRGADDVIRQATNRVILG